MMRAVLAMMFLFCCVAALNALYADDPPTIDRTEADKLFNEGNALLKSGNYAGAIEKYRGAIQQFDGDFRYYYQLGLALKNNNQLSESIQILKKCIELRPDFAIGYNALGGVYLSTKRFDDAIAAFSSALQHDRGLRHARHGLSESFAGKAQELLNAGKFNEAISVLMQATVEHPENSKLHLLLATAYNKMDRPAEAVEAANEAIKHKTRGSKGAEYFELGLAYKKLGQKDKAREAFLQARKDPAYARNADYELEGMR